MQSLIGLSKQFNDEQSKDQTTITKDNDKQREYDLALGMYDLELAIAEAAANGQDKKLEKLEREKAIIEESARIADALNIGYDEALQKATKLVDTQKRAEDADKGEGGRSKIRGYSQEQGDASQARTRAQERVTNRRESLDTINTSRFDEMDAAQKQKFGGLFGNAPAENGPGKTDGGMSDLKSTFSDVGEKLSALTEALAEAVK